MKNILLIFMVMLSMSSFSQVYENIRMDREDLPCYLVANGSDTLGILFSVPDVQVMDKNLELLEYLEKRSSKIDTTIYYYISLVGDLELKNNLLKDKLVTTLSKDMAKDDIINGLKSQISSLNTEKIGTDTIITNNESIIKSKDKEIKKQKILKSFFAGAGVIAVAVTIIILKGLGQ